MKTNNLSGRPAGRYFILLSFRPETLASSALAHLTRAGTHLPGPRHNFLTQLRAAETLTLAAAAWLFPLDLFCPVPLLFACLDPIWLTCRSVCDRFPSRYNPDKGANNNRTPVD